MRAWRRSERRSRFRRHVSPVRMLRRYPCARRRGERTSRRIGALRGNSNCELRLSSWANGGDYVIKPKSTRRHV